MNIVRRVTIKTVLAALWLYRNCLSPLKPQCCRFQPTCSAYARDAIVAHGLWRGCGLALWRLCRCHPFYRGPLYDPIPPSPSNTPRTHDTADSRGSI